MPLDYRPRKEWLLREFAPFRSQILSTTPSTLSRFEGVLCTTITTDGNIQEMP